MNSVIIFDVSNNEEEVLKMMNARGYIKDWMAFDKRYYLPHNIIWKPNTETERAMEDLNMAIASLNSQLSVNCELLRCIVLNSTPWSGITGKPVR